MWHEQIENAILLHEKKFHVIDSWPDMVRGKSVPSAGLDLRKSNNNVVINESKPDVILDLLQSRKIKFQKQRVIAGKKVIMQLNEEQLKIYKQLDITGNERYIIYNGNYLDLHTGLLWHRDIKDNMTYNQALDYTKRLGSNWQIPTMEELHSIVDYNKCNPATTLPDMKASWFWSSSGNDNYSNNSWTIHFYGGDVYNYNKDRNSYVRCVNTGPLGKIYS